MAKRGAGCWMGFGWHQLLTLITDSERNLSLLWHSINSALTAGSSRGCSIISTSESARNKWELILKNRSSGIRDRPLLFLENAEPQRRQEGPGHSSIWSSAAELPLARVKFCSMVGEQPLSQERRMGGRKGSCRTLLPASF